MNESQMNYWMDQENWMTRDQLEDALQNAPIFCRECEKQIIKTGNTYEHVNGQHYMHIPIPKNRL
jgi:hypothetical protein